MVQLDKLALETSVHLSLETARSQLQDLLRKKDHDLKSAVACPTQDMIEDCEASTPALEPPKASDVAVRNLNGGKIHRSLNHGEAYHPREWRTRCSWHFGSSHTTYEFVPLPKDGRHCCKKCFPEFKAATGHDDSQSSSSSSGTNSSSESTS